MKTSSFLPALTLSLLLVPALHAQKPAARQPTRNDVRSALEKAKKLVKQLERAKSLIGEGQPGLAEAKVRVAQREIGALQAELRTLRKQLVAQKKTESRAALIREYVAHVKAQQNSGGKSKGVLTEAETKEAVRYLSEIKVRILSVRSDKPKTLPDEELGVPLSLLLRVATKLLGENQEVTARIVETGAVGLDAYKNTLRGRLKRKRRDLRPGKTIELRLAPRSVGTLREGDEYWLVITPRVMYHIVPALIGGVGRSHIVFAKLTKRHRRA